MTDIILRDLAGMAEFRAAEDLQRVVWGEGDQADPADLMMVIAAEGGIAAGAFRGHQLLGYVFGFPTVTPGVQHSHRLATHPEARGLGLGAALKWYQRDWCLARGIGHIRWTYDPLRHANANLNIAKLGAVARVYYPDYYGAMPGINQGAPSDRLLADWMLDAPDVVSRRAGKAAAVFAGASMVVIPADFGALLATDPEKAVRERLAVRVELQARFAQGYMISGYSSANCSYLLTKAKTAPQDAIGSVA
jgi:predicted GNAT superfamily acetyltransferase